MERSILVLTIAAALAVLSVTAEDISTDPRGNEDINNALKENARYHCNYRCHQNPDDCSKEARRDLTTCERLLYWVYFNNYEACVNDCKTSGCSSRCSAYVDCESSCLRISSNKVRKSTKTPDQLIRSYFDKRREGRRFDYIE